jgi:hypothetical protein
LFGDAVRFLMLIVGEAKMGALPGRLMGFSGGESKNCLLLVEYAGVFERRAFGTGLSTSIGTTIVLSFSRTPPPRPRLLVTGNFCLA